MERIEYIPCSNEFIAKYGLTKEIRDAAALRVLVEQAKREAA